MSTMLTMLWRKWPREYVQSLIWHRISKTVASACFLTGSLRLFVYFIKIVSGVWEFAQFTDYSYSDVSYYIRTIWVALPFVFALTVGCEGIVLLSVGIHTDKCVTSGLLSVWIRTADCASIYHTIHTLALTLTIILTLSLTLNLTLNLTLISSYLTNKHQYPQPNISANWMTSRLRNKSAVHCKNCRPVPIGCTDNMQICQYAPYWQ